MLVEVFHREALVAIAIEPFHLFGPVGGNPLAGRLAEPPVDQAFLAVFLVAARPTPERPDVNPEQLRRLLLIELRRFPTAQKPQKHNHAHP
jgi:hypothetical protein